MHVIKDLPTVPAERAIKVIGGRWKLYIVYFLLEKPLRLSELERSIPAARQKVLVEHLRELEEHGVVRREVFAEVPSRVQYSLTPLGQSLQPVVELLCAWGRRHAAEHGVISEAPGNDDDDGIDDIDDIDTTTSIEAR